MSESVNDSPLSDEFFRQQRWQVESCGYSALADNPYSPIELVAERAPDELWHFVIRQQQVFPVGAESRPDVCVILGCKETEGEVRLLCKSLGIPVKPQMIEECA